MQHIEHRAVAVRDAQTDPVLSLAERLLDGGEQGVHALPGLCRDLNALVRAEERDDVRIALIRLVVDHEARNILRAELRDDLVDRFRLHLPVLVGNIHDVQQQVGIGKLLERRLERRDQMMRQLADKAYRVGQENFLRVRNALFARGRVERIEQAVIRLDTGAGQRVQERTLARVRVADDGDHGQLGLFALAALHRAHLPHLLEIASELVDAAADMTAVALELALAGASGADAAAEAAHRLAHAGQTGQDILILRQLDL